MKRTKYIRKHLIRTVEGMDGEIILLKRADYLALATDPQYRFGWMPPKLREDGKLVYTLCPKLIATTSAFLDDFMLKCYVKLIEAYLAGHTMRFGEPYEEINDFVWETLYESAPTSNNLAAQVQTFALDHNLLDLEGET